MRVQTVTVCNQKYTNITSVLFLPKMFNPDVIGGNNQTAPQCGALSRHCPGLFRKRSQEGMRTVLDKDTTELQKPNAVPDLRKI